MPIHGVVGIAAIIGVVSNKTMLDELGEAAFYSGQWCFAQSKRSERIERGSTICGESCEDLLCEELEPDSVCAILESWSIYPRSFAVVVADDMAADFDELLGMSVSFESQYGRVTQRNAIPKTCSGAAGAEAGRYIIGM